MRRSGVLLPVSSISSQYGIGAFSKEAYGFVDFLEKAGQKIWQILPLGTTGYGDSPYQSFSTFAGNPYFIDLEDLIIKGWLTKEECQACDFGDEADSIDYEKIYLSRFVLLQIAFERSDIRKDGGFNRFREENAYWLEDYALYMAIKNSNKGNSFMEWEESIRTRKEAALIACRDQLEQDISFYCFLQYIFQDQWYRLKAYANKKGIKIVGDIPIYVAFDSADTWANPELFQLDEKGYPINVAGCPPDAFSDTGQLWGNPLYRWEYHKETGFSWWMKRLSYAFTLYDIVRIDHFRGFDEYYAIPYGDPTAEFGHWEKGPGYDLFEVMKNTLGEKEVIAEDLGFLTESVIHLVKQSGFPGMKVLQFAFDSREESDYLPHNYNNNCVVYTGTHDNDTTLGWFRSFDKEDRAFAKRYLHIKSNKDLHWQFIRAALSSVADTAIIPMQDYLGLTSVARINTPSTLGNNWKWRLLEGQLEEQLAEDICNMTKLYGR